MVTLVGFHLFYLAGEGMRGRKISPSLFPLVLVHGALMTILGGVGYAFMVLLYVSASRFAVSDAWSDLAKAILNI
jgi:hypothetical protein